MSPLEPSCLVWPAVDHASWYIAQRSTGREYRVRTRDLSREEVWDLLTDRDREHESDHPLEKELARLDLLDLRNSSSWKPVVPDMSSAASAAISATVLTDCDFGDLVRDVVADAVPEAHVSSVRVGDLTDIAPNVDIVLATAGYRPRLLHRVIRHVASLGGAVLPAFFHGTFVLVGPWLREAQCPCATCLHIRLGAAAARPDAFEAAWFTAERTPGILADRLIEVRDRELGLRVARTVAAHAFRLRSGELEPDRALRVDVRTGAHRHPVLLPVPLHHEDRSLRIPADLQP